MARQDSKTYLATGDSGLVEVINIDSLVYYRDVYRRTR